MEKFLIRTDSPSPIRGGALRHRGGQQQQPGADFEMGRFGATQVDVETDFIVLEVEAYHPTVRQEVVGFSDCENGRPPEALQDCGLAPGFVTAEEKDVAALNLRRLAYQVDMEYTGSDSLPLNGALKFLAARFVVEYAKL
jgi:hypothetical protein